jgi:hypothetical protein
VVARIEYSSVVVHRQVGLFSSLHPFLPHSLHLFFPLPSS